MLLDAAECMGMPTRADVCVPRAQFACLVVHIAAALRRAPGHRGVKTAVRVAVGAIAFLYAEASVSTPRGCGCIFVHGAPEILN